MERLCQGIQTAEYKIKLVPPPPNFVFENWTMGLLDLLYTHEVLCIYSLLEVLGAAQAQNPQHIMTTQLTTHHCHRDTFKK